MKTIDLVKIIIESPYFTSGISFLGLLLTFIFYRFSIKDQKPFYFFTKSTILAQSLKRNPELKIIWNNNEITNAKTIKFAFYNIGKKPIHRNNISTDNPITIKCTKKINLLTSYIEKVSRDTIDLNILTDTINSKITIIVNNDDAFEKNDGFLLNILYSSNEEIDEVSWKVDARIIGVPKGIRKKRIKNINKVDNIMMPIWAILFTLIFVLFFNILDKDIFSNIFHLLPYLIPPMIFGVFLGLIRVWFNNVPLWLKYIFWQNFKDSD